MRVLAITKIFPNSLEPLSSPFNRQQFGALSRHCELEVLEAIPYFPAAKWTGKPPRAARLSALPEREVVGGIVTHYMRQLYVPRVGLSVALPLYLASLAPYRELARSFDAILSTWAYPDGAAATLFARALGKPVVVKVHGTDVNVVAKKPVPRAVLRRTLPLADGVVTVSRALGDELAAIGVPRARLHLVRNGVDTELFRPRDRLETRRALGLPESAKVILFVGRLEPQKGLAELLEAFENVRRDVPSAVLALVGEGVLRPEVSRRMARLPGAIVAPGARPLAEVALWMSAADVFTLPSWNEGTPNVVLEALASGRPAVGTRVGGIPDVLADPRSGLLVPVRDPDALARALAGALARSWDPEDVRRTGPASWDESGAALYDVLAAITKRTRSAPVEHRVNGRGDEPVSFGGGE